MTTHNIKGFEVPFQPTKRYFERVWTEYEPNKRVLLPKGWRRMNRLALREPIVWNKDVAVEMRDGTKIRADIFRPASRENEPLPTLVAWSPYGKTGTGFLQIQDYSYIGLRASQISGLEKFEAPDPAEWCPRGYALVQPEARGIHHSEGDFHQFGTQVRSITTTPTQRTGDNHECRKLKTDMILSSGLERNLGATAMWHLWETLGLASCNGLFTPLGTHAQVSIVLTLPEGLSLQKSRLI